MTTVSETTNLIKKFALSETNIDKIGIASVDRFNGAPEGFHPTDFLPGCKSVISCALRIPDGAAQATFRQSEDRMDHLHGIYGAYGYVGAPNYILLFAAYRIAQFVEKTTNEIAMPCTAGPSHGGKMMSMRHSAVAAGLGEFGWHSIVITPEFGTRNRFCAILTTAELAPDPLYSGPKLCDPTKCSVCVEMCPTCAIPKYDINQARTCNIGGKENVYSAINWNLCKVYTSGFYKGFNESGDDTVDLSIKYPLSSDVEKGYVFQAENPANQFFFHITTWKCGYCLLYCPVGNWKERFFDKNLSRIDTSKYISE